MPRAIDLAVAPPPSGAFTFPHWAVFLVVLAGLPIILLGVWLAYSYHKGSLCRGGEASVTRKVSVEVNDQPLGEEGPSVKHANNTETFRNTSHNDVITDDVSPSSINQADNDETIAVEIRDMRPMEEVTFEVSQNKSSNLGVNNKVSNTPELIEDSKVSQRSVKKSVVLDVPESRSGSRRRRRRTEPVQHEDDERNGRFENSEEFLVSTSAGNLESSYQDRVDTDRKMSRRGRKQTDKRVNWKEPHHPSTIPSDNHRDNDLYSYDDGNWKMPEVRFQEPAHRNRKTSKRPQVEESYPKDQLYVYNIFDNATRPYYGPDPSLAHFRLEGSRLMMTGEDGDEGIRSMEDLHRHIRHRRWESMDSIERQVELAAWYKNKNKRNTRSNSETSSRAEDFVEVKNDTSRSNTVVTPTNKSSGVVSAPFNRTHRPSITVARLQHPVIRRTSSELHSETDEAPWDDDRFAMSKTPVIKSAINSGSNHVNPRLHIPSPKRDYFSDFEGFDTPSVISPSEPRFATISEVNAAFSEDDDISVHDSLPRKQTAPIPMPRKDKMKLEKTKAVASGSLQRSLTDLHKAHRASPDVNNSLNIISMHSNARSLEEGQRFSSTPPVDPRTTVMQNAHINEERSMSDISINSEAVPVTTVRSGAPSTNSGAIIDEKLAQRKPATELNSKSEQVGQLTSNDQRQNTHLLTNEPHLTSSDESFNPRPPFTNSQRDSQKREEANVDLYVPIAAGKEELSGYQMQALENERKNQNALNTENFALHPSYDPGLAGHLPQQLPLLNYQQNQLQLTQQQAIQQQQQPQFHPMFGVYEQQNRQKFHSQDVAQQSVQQLLLQQQEIERHKLEQHALQQQAAQQQKLQQELLQQLLDQQKALQEKDSHATQQQAMQQQILQQQLLQIQALQQEAAEQQAKLQKSDHQPQSEEHQLQTSQAAPQQSTIDQSSALMRVNNITQPLPGSVLRHRSNPFVIEQPVLQPKFIDSNQVNSTPVSGEYVVQQNAEVQQPAQQFQVQQNSVLQHYSQFQQPQHNILQQKYNSQLQQVQQNEKQSQYQQQLQQVHQNFTQQQHKQQLHQNAIQQSYNTQMQSIQQNAVQEPYNLQYRPVQHNGMQQPYNNQLQPVEQNAMQPQHNSQFQTTQYSGMQPPHNSQWPQAQQNVMQHQHNLQIQLEKEVLLRQLLNIQTPAQNRSPQEELHQQVSQQPPSLPSSMWQQGNKEFAIQQLLLKQASPQQDVHDFDVLQRTMQHQAALPHQTVIHHEALKQLLVQQAQDEQALNKRVSPMQLLTSPATLAALHLAQKQESQLQNEPPVPLNRSQQMYQQPNTIRHTSNFEPHPASQLPTEFRFGAAWPNESNILSAETSQPQLSESTFLPRQAESPQQLQKLKKWLRQMKQPVYQQHNDRSSNEGPAIIDTYPTSYTNRPNIGTTRATAVLAHNSAADMARIQQMAKNIVNDSYNLVDEHRVSIEDKTSLIHPSQRARESEIPIRNLLRHRAPVADTTTQYDNLNNKNGVRYPQRSDGGIISSSRQENIELQALLSEAFPLADSS